MQIELSDLIAWLQTKPADGRYNPNETGGCLLFQFLKEKGAPVDSVSYDHYLILGDKMYLTPREAEYAATARTNPRQYSQLPDVSTYGEALARALNPVLTGEYNKDDIV